MTTQTTPTVVMAWTNHKTHITDTPNESVSVKTRCGLTLKNFRRNTFGTGDCPRCGTPDNYDVIRQHQREEYQAAEEARAEAHRAAAERERIATAERKQIAKAMAEAVATQFNAEIVGIDNWARCDNYTLMVNGHKFEIKAKL